MRFCSEGLIAAASLWAGGVWEMGRDSASFSQRGLSGPISRAVSRLAAPVFARQPRSSNPPSFPGVGAA